MQMSVVASMVVRIICQGTAPSIYLGGKLFSIHETVCVYVPHYPDLLESSFGLGSWPSQKCVPLGIK